MTRQFFFGVLALVFAVLPLSARADAAAVKQVEMAVRATAKRGEARLELGGFSYVCAYGTAADVEKALAAGAGPNAPDPLHDNAPPLAVAAVHNPDPGVVRALLAAGADVNAAVAPNARTPLHLAIMSNPKAEPVVAALLGGDPDIYAMDRYGYTPLDFAISGTYRNGAFNNDPREDLVLMLLEACERLPYTLRNLNRKEFMTRRMRQYDINLGRARRDKDIINAFKRLGADERVLKDR